MPYLTINIYELRYYWWRLVDFACAYGPLDSVLGQTTLVKVVLSTSFSQKNKTQTFSARMVLAEGWSLGRGDTICWVKGL